MALVDLIHYLEEKDKRADLEKEREQQNAEIIASLGKGPRRKKMADHHDILAGPNSAGKRERAKALSHRKAKRAIKQAKGDTGKAAQLLWSWSRTDTALQNALIVMSIEALTE